DGRVLIRRDQYSSGPDPFQPPPTAGMPASRVVQQLGDSGEGQVITDNSSTIDREIANQNGQALGQGQGCTVAGGRPISFSLVLGLVLAVVVLTGARRRRDRR